MATQPHDRIKAKRVMSSIPRRIPVPSKPNQPRDNQPSQVPECGPWWRWEQTHVVSRHIHWY